MLDFTSQCWISPRSSGSRPARPVGSARAVPAPPSARGVHQMARYALPRDLLAERTEVPFGLYGIGRRRAVFRTCRPCFRIIILARLSTFASKTPAVAGVLLVGLHYTAFRDAIRENSRQTTPSRGVTQRKKFAVEANVESRVSLQGLCISSFQSEISRTTT